MLEADKKPLLQTLKKFLILLQFLDNKKGKNM